MVPPNNGNPTPSIQWTTDSPTRLSISPSVDNRSATLTALGPSGFQAGYDIHVTVTYDGTPSSPFPVLVNTPFTMTTSTDVAAYTCQQLGFPSNWVGYGNVVSHGIADLIGLTMAPIDVKESLEKQQWLNSTIRETHIRRQHRGPGLLGSVTRSTIYFLPARLRRTR